MANILIAEDDTVTSNLLTLALKKLGHHSVSVTNGEECLEVIQTANLDLLILDLTMPKKDGIKVLEFIRNNLENRIPIIIFSSIDNRKVLKHCESIGISDYMIKPVTGQKFVQRINQIFFNIEHDHLKKILKKLPNEEMAYFSLPEFRSENPSEFSIHPLTGFPFPAALKINRNLEKKLSRGSFSESEIKNGVEIYGEGYKWKKIWPQHAPIPKRYHAILNSIKDS